MAVIFGFSFAVSIIIVPVMIAGMFSGGFDFGNMMGMQRNMQIALFSVMIFAYPVLLPWLPAIFLDREKGVTDCFRNGHRAGFKKYPALLPVSLLMILPSLILILSSRSLFTMVSSQYFYFLYPYMAVIMPALVSYLFVLYDRWKDQSRNRSIKV